ncbi:hypothetical protein Tco_1431099 [Tanacetum coccineum]
MLGDLDQQMEKRADDGKANVVTDALSKKERVKPRRVRAMAMTIQYGINRWKEKEMIGLLGLKGLLGFGLYRAQKALVPKFGVLLSVLAILGAMVMTRGFGDFVAKLGDKMVMEVLVRCWSDGDVVVLILMLRVLNESVEKDSGTRIQACFRDELDIVVEEEDGGWICFLGGNNSSGTKKYQGSNSSDGGNTGDGVKIASGVI